MLQYNAGLVITGAIKDKSRDRIYRVLVLEYFAERRWSRQICFFHKLKNGLLPVYLKSYISDCGEGVYRTRSPNQKNVRQFSTRTKKSESSFFPYCIKEWNNLSKEFQKIKSTIQFKTKFSVPLDPKKMQLLRFIA